MAINPTDIQRGMDVYGRDGEKLGTVVEVFGSEFGGEGPGTGVPHGQTPSGDPVPLMTVYHHGLLGMGSENVRVPADAVENVVPNDRVILSCDKHDFVKRFGTAG